MTMPRRRFARPEPGPIADLAPDETCACQKQITNADGRIVQHQAICMIHHAMAKRDQRRNARRNPGRPVSNAAERRAEYNRQPRPLAAPEPSVPRSKRRSGNGYQKDAA